MNRKMEIINGIRVSKCGAKHMKPFPAVVMTRPDVKLPEIQEPIKKKEQRKPEPMREERKEPESLFDFRKGRRENATTEDEQ
jgi:hypothetical protein